MSEHAEIIETAKRVLESPDYHCHEAIEQLAAAVLAMAAEIEQLEREKRKAARVGLIQSPPGGEGE